MFQKFKLATVSLVGLLFTSAAMAQTADPVVTAIEEASAKGINWVTAAVLAVIAILAVSVGLSLVKNALGRS